MSVRCDGHSDTEAVKRLSGQTCLKCNGRDGVLVCSNAGCPVVIHMQCMHCAAHFDDGGNFYCPYCAYKRSLDELRKAKESTSLAKKSLVGFLDTMAAQNTEDLQAVKSSKTERSGGGEFTFQNDILQDGLRMKLVVPKEPDEIRDEGIIRNNDHLVMDDNVMPLKLDSDNLKTKRQKTAVSLEGHCNQGVQRKQTRKEPHKATVSSTRTGMMEKDRDTDKINAATKLDKNTSSEQLKVNSENGDQFAEIQKDQCDDVCHKRKHDTSVTHKKSGKFSGQCERSKDTEEVYYEKVKEIEQQHVEGSINLTRKDGLSVTNKVAMDRNDGGIAKKVHKQTQPQVPTKENAEVTNQEAEEVNCGVCEDENLSSQMAVNKNNADRTSNTRDLHCRKADDEGNQAKLQKDDVISTSKENSGVSYEKSDPEDKIKSSQEKHCTGYGLRTKNQPKKSPSSFESEFEEYAEVTHVKTRRKIDSSNQIQGTPVFVGRRKKLPWTTEEVQVLEEGVDKFSLTTKKNIPWMKILEFGSHIFDGTRTPDDLKDKWRRVLSKAHVID